MGKWDRFDAYSSLIARGPVFPTAHGQDSEARSGTDWDRGSVARGRAVGETYSEEEFPAGWEARMPTRWASSPGRRCSSAAGGSDGQQILDEVRTGQTNFGEFVS
jgi:hypothetical protein